MHTPPPTTHTHTLLTLASVLLSKQAALTGVSCFKLCWSVWSLNTPLVTRKSVFSFVLAPHLKICLLSNLLALMSSSALLSANHDSLMVASQSPFHPKHRLASYHGYSCLHKSCKAFLLQLLLPKL